MINFLISNFPLLCLGGCAIAGVLSEGYRKGNPPNHKMSQLLSYISIGWVIIGLITMGASK